MTTKTQILKAIRAYCIGCSGGSEKEVSHCTVTYCERDNFSRQRGRIIAKGRLLQHLEEGKK